MTPAELTARILSEGWEPCDWEAAVAVYQREVDAAIQRVAQRKTGHVKGIRKQTCRFCPYRRDVPSGMWAAREYAKLPPYDAPTYAQPFLPFVCHATPEFYCHGWAVAHSNRGHEFDLLALRFSRTEVVIPKPDVPLFASGTEAATHGVRDLGHQTAEAIQAITYVKTHYKHIKP